MDLIFFESNRFIMLLGAFTLVALVFAITTIAHIIFKNEDKRNVPIWILTVLIFPVIGSIIYWFVFNREKQRSRKFDPFKSR